MKLDNINKIRENFLISFGYDVVFWTLNISRELQVEVKIIKEIQIYIIFDNAYVKHIFVNNG